MLLMLLIHLYYCSAHALSPLTKPPLRIHWLTNTPLLMQRSRSTSSPLTNPPLLIHSLTNTPLLLQRSCSTSSPSTCRIECSRALSSRSRDAGKTGIYCYICVRILLYTLLICDCMLLYMYPPLRWPDAGKTGRKLPFELYTCSYTAIYVSAACCCAYPHSAKCFLELEVAGKSSETKHSSTLLQYISVSILLHMCATLLQYVSVSILLYMCAHTISVSILLYMCAHTYARPRDASEKKNCALLQYVSVSIPLYMCTQCAYVCEAARCWQDRYTAISVSSYYYIYCHMSPHTVCNMYYI
jgi:hypothetical protein